MDKNNFLKELSKGLSKLPKKERDILIDFYSELIDDKIEGGQSEADVIASFGSLNVLVERLLIENPNRKRSGCFYLMMGAIGALVIIMIGFGLLLINFSDDEDYLKDKNNNTIISANISNSSKQGDYQVASYNYMDIDKIFVESDTNEVVFEKSKDNNINIRYKEYENEINSIELKGGKLKFDNEQKSNKLNKKADHIIYLEIPEEYYGVVDESVDVGSVKMNGFNMTEINLATDIGDIELEDCTAINIELSSGMGNVSVKNTVGELTFEASSDMGNIDFIDIDAQMIDISTDMGAIEGKLLGKQEDYSIVNEIGMGKSNVLNQTGGTKTLKVSTDMGKVDLSFGK